MDSTLIWVVTIAGGLIAIIKSAFSLLQYIVKNIVNPLSASIATLQSATNELRSIIERIKNDMQALDKRIIIVEQSTKSAHKRIDRLSDICDSSHKSTLSQYRGGEHEND